MKDNDFYIKLLKWADARETFTLKDIQKEFNISDDQIGVISHQIRNRQLFSTNSPMGFDAKLKQTKLWMSVEDKFRLIEYDELKEAREASKNATYFASAALVISILTLIASIVQMYLST
jgi:hypothetical protein